MSVVIIGTGFESKMQLVLLVVLTVSLVNFVVGTFFPISTKQDVRGITGYSCKFCYLCNQWCAWDGLARWVNSVGGG
jgi:hypothetical protein